MSDMISRMKILLYGILFIVLIGVGGLVYRNAVERLQGPVACPMDAKLCPDGTAVGRTGLSCTFPVCPPPNVTLAEVGISFAIPEGFTATTTADATVVAAYAQGSVFDASSGEITIRRYAVATSSTALAVIQATAIGGASGLRVPATAFSSRVIGDRRFTIVSIERFEAVVHTAYYLARGTDVLRFDAIDRGVRNWTDPQLQVAMLSAHAALLNLLVTLQGG